MDRIRVFAGLDYHQSSVQVCVMDASGRVLHNRRCSNDWRAIVDRVEACGSVVRVALESCGGAADLAEELVRHSGWSVDLAHPGFVCRMKQSPDKTDFGDARLLADLTRVGYLPRVWLAPAQVRELRRLVRYRQQLVNERRNIKLRVSALLRDQRILQAPAHRWTRAWIHWLRQTDDLGEHSRWIVDRHLARFASLIEELPGHRGGDGLGSSGGDRSL
jgi:transposase